MKQSLMLVGRSGSGKTSVMETLLGSEVKNAREIQSVTRFGPEIQVKETYGFFSNNQKLQCCIQDIESCIHKFSGIDVIGLVIRIGRFTLEESDMIEIFRDTLGESAFNFTIVIFTNLDNLLYDDVPMSEFLEDSPQQLHDLLSLCSGRYVCFDNKGPETDRQGYAKSLIKAMKDLQEGNKSAKYTPDMMDLAMKAKMVKDAEKAKEEEHKVRVLRERAKLEIRAEVEAKVRRELVQEKLQVENRGTVLKEKHFSGKTESDDASHVRTIFMQKMDFWEHGRKALQNRPSVEQRRGGQEHTQSPKDHGRTIREDRGYTDDHWTSLREDRGYTKDLLNSGRRNRSYSEDHGRSEHMDRRCAKNHWTSGHEYRGYTEDQGRSGLEDREYTENHRSSGREDREYTEDHRRSGREDREYTEDHRRSGREDKEYTEVHRRSGREDKEYTEDHRRSGREDKEYTEDHRRSGREDRGYVEHTWTNGREDRDYREDHRNSGREGRGYIKDYLTSGRDDRGYTEDHGRSGRDDRGYTEDHGKSGRDDRGYTEDHGRSGRDDRGYTEDHGKSGRDDRGYTEDHGKSGRDDRGYTEDHGRSGRDDRGYTEDHGRSGRDDRGYTEDHGRSGRDDRGYTEDHGRSGRDDRGYTEDHGKSGRDDRGYTEDHGKSGREDRGYTEDYGRSGLWDRRYRERKIEGETKSQRSNQALQGTQTTLVLRKNKTKHYLILRSRDDPSNDKTDVNQRPNPRTQHSTMSTNVAPKIPPKPSRLKQNERAKLENQTDTKTVSETNEVNSDMASNEVNSNIASNEVNSDMASNEVNSNMASKGNIFQSLLRFWNHL